MPRGKTKVGWAMGLFLLRWLWLGLSVWLAAGPPVGFEPSPPPPAACGPYLTGERPLRIGLGAGLKQAELTCDSPLELVADQTMYAIGAGEVVLVRLQEGKVRVTTGARELGVCSSGLGFRPTSAGARTRIACNTHRKREFPGRFEILPDSWAAPTAFALVNIVALEDYVPIVLASEMPASFGAEALEAQAILARTYTLAHVGRHAPQGFDLCADVHCQAYAGYRPGSPAPGQVQAAQATRGQLLVRDGALAEALYHSTCANPKDMPGLAQCGSLADDKAVEGLLANTTGAYCSESKRYRWEQSFTLSQAQTLIRANGPRLLGLSSRSSAALKLRDIRIAGRDPDGRARCLDITTDAGCYRIAGEDIRWLFGEGKPSIKGLASRLFVLTAQKDTKTGQPARFVFRGGGWGHGQGLCQWGAKGRAEVGQSAAQILAAYYPGTHVVSGRQAMQVSCAE